MRPIAAMHEPVSKTILEVLQHGRADADAIVPIVAVPTTARSATRMLTGCPTS